ncbi:MAG: AsmA-like C-terminal region-containing protein [Kiritimatiellaeota bacterium]|nr:AsmA-like C-terminal region-containing protein [Kiritimatiellota bacterium]
MKTRTQESRRRHRLKFRWVILATVVVVGFLAVQLAARGLPTRWERLISEKLSTEEFIVRLEHINFHLVRGVGVRRILVMARANPQTPLIRLDDAAIRLAMRPGEPWLNWVQEISVYRVEMPELPKVGAMRGGGGEEGGMALPVFGPVQFECAHAEVLGISGRRVGCAISSNGRRLQLADCAVDLAPHNAPSEEMRGSFNLEFAPSNFEGRAAGQLNPARLVPHFNALGLAYMADMTACFTVPADPLSVELTWEYAPEKHLRKLILDIDAASLVRFLTVSFMSLQGRLFVEGTDSWRWLRVRNLRATRPEGEIAGTLIINVDENWLELDAVSTMDPLLLPGLAGMPIRLPPGTVRFPQGSRIAAKGVLALADTATHPTDIHATLETPTLWFQRIRLDSVVAEMGVTGERLTVERFAGRCYGGTVGALGSLLWAHDTPVADVSLRLNRVNVGPLVETLQQDSLFASDPGWFDMDVDVSGALSTNALMTLTGQGTCRMREARLYRFPLFAGLTDFLGRNVPGVDFLLSQNDLNAVFAIENGGIHFSRLNIEGNIFSIIASGSYWLDDDLDIGLKVGLLRQGTILGRVLRIVLFPVSKLFELEVTGPVASPSWSPTTLTLRWRRASRDRPHDTPAFQPATIEE